MSFDRRDVAAETRPWYKSLDRQRMTVIVEIIDLDTEEEREATLPVKFVVCPTCDGRGTHVNPSIDAHGITAEEWDRDWDDEEREAYLSGRYDVPCYECKGANVVPEVDERRADPAVVKLLDDQRASAAESDRISRMERMMGA